MPAPKPSVPERIDALAHRLQNFAALYVVLAILSVVVFFGQGMAAESTGEMFEWWFIGLGSVITLLWLRAISNAAAVLLWLAMPEKDRWA